MLTASPLLFVRPFRSVEVSLKTLNTRVELGALPMVNEAMVALDNSGCMHRRAGNYFFSLPMSREDSVSFDTNNKKYATCIMHSFISYNNVFATAINNPT